MKIIIMTTLFSILNWGVNANCAPFFAKFFKNTENGFDNTPEYKYRARQKKLENQTNFLRTSKDNRDPALNLKIYDKIEKMNVFIFNDIHAPNERMWRTFFREFEADFISFDRVNKLLKELPSENLSKEQLKSFIEKPAMGFSESYQSFLLRSYDSMGAEGLLAALAKERSQTIPRLASNYQEYRMVRGNLEGLLKRSDCDDICKKQVNLLLGRIGADSKKEKMINDVFFEDTSRPEIAAIRELLYEEPDFVLTKLKRERNAEFFRLLKGFITQPEFVDTLFGYIYKNPKLRNNPRVNFLFREIYNSHARNSHFPKISKVIHSPDKAPQSFDLLRRLNTAVPKDELLITFARRVDSLASSRWKSLLDHAQEVDPDFAARMKKAAEVAQKRGEMSPTDRRSFSGRLAAAIVVGVPTFSYFYFDIKPSELMEIIYSEDESEEENLSDQPSSNPSTSPEENEVEEMPVPDSGEPLMVDSEDDNLIDEAVEVLIEVSEEVSRTPSSISGERPPAAFTKLWCSIFTCSASKK